MSTQPQRQSSTGSEARRAQPRKRSEIAEIGIRLLDNAHDAWLAAEVECDLALRAWFAGPGGTRGGRYHSYLAALDREQAAAHDLQRLWELARSGHEVLTSAPAD
jgi:hypothetical protein